MADQLIQAPAELQQKVPALVTWARALVIVNHQQLVDATEQLKGIKTAAKQVADFFGPMKKKADEAKKAILEAEKQMAQPLALAEGACKMAMLKYQQAEESKRMAEQNRLQAEADERARKEREALEKRAEKLKTPEKKQEYQERAAAVTAPVVMVPKAAAPQGVATRKVWKAQVVDEALVPRAYLVVDQKALDGVARAMRERADVPGVRFFTEEVMAIRS